MSTRRWGRCGTKRLLTGAAGGTCHQGSCSGSAALSAAGDTRCDPATAKCQTTGQRHVYGAQRARTKSLDEEMRVVGMAGEELQAVRQGEGWGRGWGQGGDGDGVGDGDG